MADRTTVAETGEHADLERVPGKSGSANSGGRAGSLIDAELAGLDALAAADAAAPRIRTRLWAGTWPKLIAIAIAVAAWQIVVWSHWKPQYLLPGPFTVLNSLRQQVTTSDFWDAVGVTMTHAVEGYALALVIGLVVGLGVVRSKVLRSGVGSLLTGLQSMPSIVWLPLAGLLFGIADPVPAIMFVVVLGAAPSIAAGMVAGFDHVPPVLVRAGRVLGARGLRLTRSVVLPAALPEIMSGLKTGWAYAWRSLMSAELINISAHTIGGRLNFAQNNLEPDVLLATMIVILVIGIGVDSIFGIGDRAISKRWGLHKED